MKSYKLSGVLAKNLDSWDKDIDKNLVKDGIEKVNGDNNTEEAERIIGDMLFEICLGLFGGAANIGPCCSNCTISAEFSDIIKSSCRHEVFPETQRVELIGPI